MNKYIELCLKFCGSLIGGLCIVVIIMHHDTWLLTTMENKFKQVFATCFKANLKCKIKSVNFITLTLELEDTAIQPYNTDDHSWTWGCKHLTAQADWFSLIMRKELHTTLYLTDFFAHSDIINQEFAITPHIKALFQSPPLIVPIIFKSASVRHGECSVSDSAHDVYAYISCNGAVTQSNKTLKSFLSISDAIIRHKTDDYIKNFTGTLSCSASWHDCTLETKFSCNLPAFTGYEQRVHGTGSWKTDKGFFEIHTDEHTLNVHLTRAGKSLLAHCKGTFLCEYIEKCLPQSIRQHFKADGKKICKGTIAIDASADLQDIHNSLQGSIKLVQPSLSNLHADQLNIAFQKQEQRYQGTVTGHITPDISVKGSWYFDECMQKMHISTDCVSDAPLKKITFQNAHYEIDLYNTSYIEGLFDASIAYLQTETKSPKLSQLSGTFKGSLDDCIIKAHLGDHTCDAKISVYPFFKINYIKCENLYKNDVCNLLFSFSYDEQQKMLNGTIDYACIKTVINELFKSDIPGQGVFHLSIKPEKQGLQGKIQFHEGSIRLPGFYNVINTLSGDYVIDLSKLTCTLHDLVIGLDQGSLHSSYSSLLFNPNGSLKFFTIPLVLDNCFLSWHKDFFATISGMCTFKGTQEHTQVKGNLIIDRSHIKGNLFGQSLLSAPRPSLGSLQFPVELDLQLITKKPLVIKLPFFQTHAYIQCVIHGTGVSPEPTGAIEIVKGSIAFPYKPLYITSGKLMIIPDQLDNPSIELCAKNTIKNYNIQVLISGTVKDPKIQFISSPDLTEEQIITLLFAGSPEGALSAIVPALVMHNVQQFIFGPQYSPSKFQQYIKKLLRPFKNIRIIPSIDNNSTNPGLHASLDVDLEDRLHGHIEKNFDNEEAAKIKVEYDVSDEVSIAGVKDEQGNLGAEVEVRFKL